MIQRATPEEYFKSIYGIERIKREQERQKEREFDKALKEINEKIKVLNEKINKIQIPKIGYQDYQNSQQEKNSIPWGLIAIISIVGLIVIGIVAISVSRVDKK